MSGTDIGHLRYRGKTSMRDLEANYIKKDREAKQLEEKSREKGRELDTLRHIKKEQLDQHRHEVKTVEFAVQVCSVLNDKMPCVDSHKGQKRSKRERVQNNSLSNCVFMAALTVESLHSSPGRMPCAPATTIPSTRTHWESRIEKDADGDWAISRALLKSMAPASFAPLLDTALQWDHGPSGTFTHRPIARTPASRNAEAQVLLQRQAKVTISLAAALLPPGGCRRK
ncbi:unnamed protein product [Polarella glacialis]|uniref:Uncharacterized protein n=1 Tax=Polarella glacialis TaxID=89957 RepID=A0A813EY98_POLGL|nr:unnamed protein product [Polarella glacialis]